MQEYEVKANVLGLAPGDTFSSDDPYYDPYWKAGYIVKIGSDDKPTTEQVTLPEGTPIADKPVEDTLLGVVQPPVTPEKPTSDPETPATPAPAPKATRKRAAAKKSAEKP